MKDVVIEHARRCLEEGCPVESVVEFLRAEGVEVEAVDDGTVLLREHFWVQPEGGEERLEEGEEGEIAESALDDEEEYYEERPVVVSVRTAQALLTGEGVKWGRERGWSRLLQEREPPCKGGEHDWQPEATYCGPNGGVTIVSKCPKCGWTSSLATRWTYLPDGSVWEDVTEYYRG